MKQAMWISKQWLEHQGNTKISSGKVWMDYIWGALIGETCLQMMIDLWAIRNEDVHSKEEATIQQKRKDKAAITVQAQHKLEEQACPSDSIQFYSDVEEAIKQAIAATLLERFSAIKTRPIHNSVRKWAERSTDKVKLIVDWIKTGGRTISKQ